MSIHTRIDLLDRPGLPAERELPHSVFLDLVLLRSAMRSITIGLGSLKEGRNTLRRVCLSRSVDDAHDQLTDLISQIEDEVLGRLDEDRERERAMEPADA